MVLAQSKGEGHQALHSVVNLEKGRGFSDPGTSVRCSSERKQREVLESAGECPPGEIQEGTKLLSGKLLPTLRH